MAIDLKNPDSRCKLQTAIKRSFEKESNARERRADLKRIYEDRPRLADLFLEDRRKTAYLNLFAMYVRGHEINFSYRSPKCAVNARTVEGKGFDKVAQASLEQYSCVLGFSSLVERWAIDSAFGRTVAKVVTSIAPKGITSPVAPRCFRINPDHFIPDRSAPHPEEMTYAADVYFVDTEEARNHPDFNRERRERLTTWGAGGASSAFMGDGGDQNLFATDQTRLIDVYIPNLGVLATWPCSSDSFSEIETEEPLQILPVECNPYVILDLIFTPDSLESISRLGQLRPLNMLANDLYTKIAQQARMSKRNPVAKIGDEMDAATLTDKPDNEVAFLNEPKALDMFVFPGPDSSVMGVADDAASKFSQGAGNLNTGLGISPGANTARQTQALIGQINEAQEVDRMKFERFLSEIYKRILTLMWKDEALQLSYATKIRGFWVNQGWGPPERLSRVGQIDDYAVEVVPYSTKFRGPQERLGQLVQASGIIFQMMQQKSMGMPINLDVVIEDCAESFDLIPNLADWYSGEPPSPQQKTGQVYQSMAGPSQGSDVNYNSNAQSGGGQENQMASQSGGLASSGNMV